MQVSKPSSSVIFTTRDEVFSQAIKYIEPAFNVGEGGAIIAYHCEEKVKV